MTATGAPVSPLPSAPLILTALAAFASLAAPRALLSTRSLALLLSLTAIPGPVLGIGLVLFWNRPGAFWRAIYDSAFMGGLAQVASFAPLIIVLGAVLAARHPPAEDEACRLAGATPLALGGRLRSLLAISALAMAWSMGEYGASSLVSAPGYGLLSARLIGLMHFGRNGETAVLSVLLSLSCAIPALLLGLASALTPSAPQETERP
jgi:ABC-type Fe3+ transport system permease subunit